MNEKRQFPRLRLRTQVIFKDEAGEGFIYFYSTDISMGGLFFESDVPLPAETPIQLSFTLGEAGEVIHTSGRVVRVEKSAETPFILGMGIKFDNLSPQVSEYIASKE